MAKNKNNMLLWSIVGIMGLMIIIGSFAVFFSVSNTEQREQTSETITNVLTSSEAAEFRAQNTKVDLEMRVEDALDDTGVSYINGSTLYLVEYQDGEAKYVTEHTLNSGSDNWVTLTDALKTAEGVTYKGYIKAVGEFNSDGMFTLTNDQLLTDPVSKEIAGTAYTPAKFKCYDNADKSKCKNVADNSTDFVTSQTVTFHQNNGSNWVGEANMIFDVTVTLRPNVTSEAKGNGIILALDTEDSSNLQDWEENECEVAWEGAALKDMKSVEGGLDFYDSRGLNDYELIYVITDETVGADFAEGDDGSVTVEKDSESTVRVQCLGGTSAPDYDIVLKAVALGDFQSQQDSSEIRRDVGFKDDTSYTELYTAQTITFDID